jgi:hypothetical protein
MRRLVFVATLVGLARVGAASPDDARTEMTAALISQVDTHPTPAVLPVATAASKLAQTPASKHVALQAAVVAGHAADQAQGQSTAAALAHEAQAAAMSAAGQAQAQAARQRAATHPHPGH